MTFSLPFSLLTALTASSLDSDHSLFQENIWDQLEKGTQSKGNITTVSKYRKHLEGNGGLRLQLACRAWLNSQRHKNKWGKANGTKHMKDHHKGNYGTSYRIRTII